MNSGFNLSHKGGYQHCKSTHRTSSQFNQNTDLTKTVLGSQCVLRVFSVCVPFFWRHETPDMFLIRLGDDIFPAPFISLSPWPERVWIHITMPIENAYSTTHTSARTCSQVQQLWKMANVFLARPQATINPVDVLLWVNVSERGSATKHWSHTDFMGHATALLSALMENWWEEEEGKWGWCPLAAACEPSMELPAGFLGQITGQATTVVVCAQVNANHLLLDVQTLSWRAYWSYSRRTCGGRQYQNDSICFLCLFFFFFFRCRYLLLCRLQVTFNLAVPSCEDRENNFPLFSFPPVAWHTLTNSQLKIEK